MSVPTNFITLHMVMTCLLTKTPMHHGIEQLDIFLRSSDDIYRPYALHGQPSSSSPYMPIHYHIDGIHRILCFLFAPVSVLVLSVPHVSVVPRPMMPTSQPSTSLLFSSSV